MTIKTETSTDAKRGLSWLFSSNIGPRVMLEADGTGSGTSEAKEEVKTTSETKVAPEVKPDAEVKSDKSSGLSDTEAKLLKEVMEKKEKLKSAEERLKAFEGVNPDEVKKLLDERANAEKTRKEAEEAALLAKGDFDRVRQMMVEEHTKSLEAERLRATETASALEKANALINDLTIGQSFSQSDFVNKELVLTPAKARMVYGSHFDIENGKVVGYDKPKGASERTPLVDASGEPLGFNDALKKLVEKDPDRDALIKSTLASGAGSKTTNAKADAKQPDVHGISRIALGLDKLTEKK